MGYQDDLEVLERLRQIKKIDQNTVVVLNHFSHNSNVTHDVAIVGFDDGDLAKIMYPQLTTLRISNVRMGTKAFERLMWKLDHRETSPEKIMMGVELRVRDSTRKIE